MGYYMTGAQDPSELRAGYLAEYWSLLTGEEVEPSQMDEFVAELQSLAAKP
jgi:hypothetical protein